MRAKLATVATGSQERSSIPVQRQALPGSAPGLLRGHPGRVGYDEYAAIQAAATRGIATPRSALPRAARLLARYCSLELYGLTGCAALTI